MKKNRRQTNAGAAAEPPASAGSRARRSAAPLALLLLLSVAFARVAVAGTTACAVDEVTSQLFGEADVCDENGDGIVSAADLTAAVIFMGRSRSTPSATPTATPTVTATSTPTATASTTPSATPTVPACPTSGATVVFAIDNRSGDCRTDVTLSGERLHNLCDPGELATSYSLDLECDGCGSVDCGGIDSLAPGLWRHSIEVRQPDQGQVQHQRALLVADAGAERVRFTVFASVLTVSTAANTGTGSLRSRLQAAPTMPKPLLIQFDPEVFPAGVATTIALEFQLTTLATDDVTVDGTDASGASGNRIIDAQALPIGAFSITGARNHIVGMRLRNAGGNDRDVLNISGPLADGNVIERTRIDTAATADGIGIDDRAGKAFDDTANVIRDCVVSGAADKGIKVTLDSYARVEHSHVHDNANGGIQATLGGKVQSIEDLVENNRGAATTAQSGLAANSFEKGEPFSESLLEVSGSIARGNGGDGVSVRGASQARVRDAYLATNGAAGLRVFNDLGDGASAFVQGTSAVCNSVDGAVVADDSRADFGGGVLSSLGNNAFTQNDLPGGAANLRNVSASLVSAINNQWENCGNEPTCNVLAIAARDLSDHAANTFFIPAQAHRALPPPVLERVVPSKGSEGELLRIFGSGFNVIDGLFAEDNCADVAGRNRCVPLRGNCVRIGGVPAAVEAVTPTMIVVRWPFTCVQPVALVVVVDQGEAGNESAPLQVCTNTGEAE